MLKTKTKAVNNTKKIVSVMEKKVVKKKNLNTKESETGKVLDQDLLQDEEPVLDEAEEAEEEDSELLDSDEVDPFKDKWEE